MKQVPLTTIVVAKGQNPRSDVDEQALSELVDSIRNLGVLQPVVVGPADKDGKHALIAGHRRIAAARRVRLKTIPAVIREDGEEALAVALTENVLREGLSPVDEARALKRLQDERGLNQKALAESLGKQGGFVRDRLRLLKLPATAQSLLHEGKLKLTVAPVLDKIASISSELAEACAKAVAAGQATPGEFADDPDYVIDQVCEAAVEEGKRPPALAIGFATRLEALIPGPGNSELRNRVRVLDGNPYLNFNEKLIDAARSYGCLLEFKGDRFGYHAQRWVCDWPWLHSIAKEEIERREKQAAKEQAKLTGTGAKAEASGAGDDADDLTKRRKEREVEQRERVAARNANLELGRKLAQDQHAPKLTMPVAKALALLVIGDDAAGLASRGLRYTTEGWQTVETKKLKKGGDRTKVTYLDPAECERKLLDWLAGAKTPQQLLGRLLQAVTAAKFADEECVARSRRSDHYFQTPGPAGNDALGSLDELLGEIAEASLPPRMAKAVAGAKKGGRGKRKAA